MHELIIKVPATITKSIEVSWGASDPITEPLGVTEIKDILVMALRDRLNMKRAHQDEVNFYGATDTDATHG